MGEELGDKEIKVGDKIFSGKTPIRISVRTGLWVLIVLWGGLSAFAGFVHVDAKVQREQDKALIDEKIKSSENKVLSAIQELQADLDEMDDKMEANRLENVRKLTTLETQTKSLIESTKGINNRLNYGSTNRRFENATPE